MLEKKLWCAFLCLLTFNLSLPYGWWMATAQAAPATPVVHAIQKSSLATTSGDEAFNELNDALSTLFGEDITPENFALELLTPIQDGVAIGVSPSGALFEIQAVHLTNVSQEVLNELEPDVAAEYPCYDFAQSFIGEIHTANASLPVVALIMKTDSCQQTSMMVTGTLSQETYEVMYDPPLISDELDEIVTQCPKSDCPVLEECYQDCFADFAALHEGLQGRLLQFQDAAAAAKTKRDMAIWFCLSAKHKANVKAYRAHLQVIDELKKAHARAMKEMLIAATIAAAHCLASLPAAPLCIGAVWAGVASAGALRRYNLRADIDEADDALGDALDAATIAFNLCKATPEGAYITTVCGLYCTMIVPMVNELRSYANCIQNCYDDNHSACAGTVSVFPHPDNFVECYPDPPSVDARFSWPTLMNGTCNCGGGGLGQP